MAPGFKNGDRGFGHSNRQGNRGPVVLIVVFLSFFLIAGTVAAVFLTKTEAVEKPAKLDKVMVSPVEPEKPTIQMVDVIVPVKDIPQGSGLQISMFAKVSRPSNSLPQNLVRTYEELQGQYAKTLLPALEPVVYNGLTREQPLNAVADMIPLGHRAVTINVNAISGVEGWASPGAQVDVQWISDYKNERKVLLLVQNAKVLSAERQVDPAAADPTKPIPTTITLMTSYRDALKISLAASSGTLVLHLRGAIDSGKTSSVTDALSVKDILRGRVDDPEAAKIQGSARIRRADGSYEELAVVDGTLLSRVK